MLILQLTTTSKRCVWHETCIARYRIIQTLPQDENLHTMDEETEDVFVCEKGLSEWLAER